MEAPRHRREALGVGPQAPDGTLAPRDVRSSSPRPIQALTLERWHHRSGRSVYSWVACFLRTTFRWITCSCRDGFGVVCTAKGVAVYSSGVNVPLRQVDVK